MYQRIMVPLDGSDRAQQALAHALDMCRAFGATLVLLHVRDAHHGSAEASQRYLNFTRRAYANSGIAIELATREGPVADAIIRTADEQHIDVIVMATHGRSGLQRVVYGSVAEQVLRSSTKPVLLVRVAGETADQPATTPRPGSSSRKLASETGPN